MAKSRILPIALPSLAIAIAMAFFMPKPGSSQPASKISPVFTVSPDTLPTGETSSVLACVHNGSPAASSRDIENGDVFSFTFGAPCTTGLNPAGTAVVNSANFADTDFDVVVATDAVTLTYTGAPVPFSSGDSFCAVVSFDGPATNSACTVQSEAPGGNRYDGLDPDFNLIFVVDFAPGGGLPTGTIVLSNTGVCPVGFAAFANFDGNFLMAGPNAGATGGSNNHVHGAGSYSAGDHSHTGEAGSATLPRLVDDNSGGENYLVSDKDHVHTLTIGSAAGGTVGGNSALAAHLPPFAEVTLCRAN